VLLLLLFLIINIRDFRETPMSIKPADSLSVFLKSGPELLCDSEYQARNIPD
jgi:hypothetical protein